MFRGPEKPFEVPVGGLPVTQLLPAINSDLSNFSLHALASVLGASPGHRAILPPPLVWKGEKFDVNEASFRVGDYHEITVKNQTYIVHRTSEKEFKIYRVIN